MSFAKGAYPQNPRSYLNPQNVANALYLARSAAQAIGSYWNRGTVSGRKQTYSRRSVPRARAKRSFRSARRPRKQPTKRNVRSFRGRKLGRKGRQSTRIKTISNMLQILTYKSTFMDQAIIPAASGTLGKRCVYFAQNVGNPLTSRDPAVWPTIAYLNDTSANPKDNLFIQRRFTIQHKLTNMASFQMRITAYKCKCRLDLPNLPPSTDLYTALGQGFASKGIDPTLPNNTNLGLTNAAYDIWQSATFLERFKVLSVNNRVLDAGESTFYQITDPYSSIIRPSKYLYFTPSQTYATATKNYNWLRGETFYLFKIQAHQIASNSSSTAQMTFATGNVDMESQINYQYQYDSSYSTGAVPNFTVSGITTAAPTTYVMSETTGNALATNTV